MVKFQDDPAGEVNLEKELWGEVFEPLKDKVKFAEVTYNKELCTIECQTVLILHRNFYMSNCALAIV